MYRSHKVNIKKAHILVISVHWKIQTNKYYAMALPWHRLYVEQQQLRVRTTVGGYTSSLSTSRMPSNYNLYLYFVILKICV